MQRQSSFRNQVKKQLETAVTESAISVLGGFERMLSTYEEEGESDSRTPTPNPPASVMGDSRAGRLSDVTKNGPLDFQYGDAPLPSLTDTEAYPSLLDIDAICNTHAPNLMRRKPLEEQPSLQVGDLEESGYFIPKSTIDKLSSVYESNNFNDLYTLSGELRHILSPVEIEEIVANRVHLEKVIDPKVLAALSWPMNESSLPPYDLSLIPPTNQNLRFRPQQEPVRGCDNSKTSSISNGFHSRNTSDASDDEVSTTSTPNYAKSGRSSSGFDTPDSAAPPTLQNNSFERGGVQTASFRRRIALAKSLAAEMEGGLQRTEDDDEYNSISLSPSPTGRNHQGSRAQDPHHHGGLNPTDVWRSLESLNDLEIEDDIDSVCSGTDELFLVRRDSKRFNKNSGSEERVIQGLFVESKMGRTNNGTLTRVRVPLNLSQEDVDGGDSDLSPRVEDEAGDAAPG